MNAYSKDLRLKTLAALDRGLTRTEVVQTFGISLATLKRWLKSRREGKDLSPRHSTGRKRRIAATPEQRKTLSKQLRENDTATLRRQCRLWKEATGVAVSEATMSRAIRQRLGWSRKKGRWWPPSETRGPEGLGGKP
jgi:transposase